MPATRSQADAAAGGAEPEVADLLEDAAAELSAESAARKAAEERVRALELEFVPVISSRNWFGTCITQ